MLVRYKIPDSKKGLLPFRHEVHFSKEQIPKTPQVVEDMRHIPYASAVGSLMYVMLCTRPNICYVVELSIDISPIRDVLIGLPLRISSSLLGE